MGAYDVVVLLEAPDDETMSAFTLKIGSMGRVKTQTGKIIAGSGPGKTDQVISSERVD